MRSERDRIGPPRREAKERANSNSAKTGGVGTFRTIEPPVKITLRTRRVHLRIDVAIVGFLVNHEAFRARGNERFVFRRFHWA